MPAIWAHGDVRTWIAMNADSRLVTNWLVGLRTSECAEATIGELASRLADRIQLTTDGNGVYLTAIEKAFGGLIDYAMLVKIYEGLGSAEQRRYSPSRFVKTGKRRFNSSPDAAEVSTSYIERQNLTLRMQNRRFARLANALSKKIENLLNSVALHFVHCNFARLHKSLRITPAMEPGLSDHVWTIEEITRLIPEPEAKRGPHKNKHGQAAEIPN